MGTVPYRPTRGDGLRQTRRVLQQRRLATPEARLTGEGGGPRWRGSNLLEDCRDTAKSNEEKNGSRHDGACTSGGQRASFHSRPHRAQVRSGSLRGGGGRGGGGGEKTPRWMCPPSPPAATAIHIPYIHKYPPVPYTRRQPSSFVTHDVSPP